MIDVKAKFELFEEVGRGEKKVVAQFGNPTSTLSTIWKKKMAMNLTPNEKGSQIE